MKRKNDDDSTAEQRAKKNKHEPLIATARGFGLNPQEQALPFHAAGDEYGFFTACLELARKTRKEIGAAAMYQYLADTYPLCVSAQHEAKRNMPLSIRRSFHVVFVRHHYEAGDGDCSISMIPTLVQRFKAARTNPSALLWVAIHRTADLLQHTQYPIQTSPIPLTSIAWPPCIAIPALEAVGMPELDKIRVTYNIMTGSIALDRLAADLQQPLDLFAHDFLALVEQHVRRKTPYAFALRAHILTFSELTQLYTSRSRNKWSSTMGYTSDMHKCIFLVMQFVLERLPFQLKNIIKESC